MLAVALRGRPEIRASQPATPKTERIPVVCERFGWARTVWFLLLVRLLNNSIAQRYERGLQALEHCLNETLHMLYSPASARS
jgi:hypothetical protein